MVTTPQPDPTPPTRANRFAEAAIRLLDSLTGLLRYVLTGERSGRIRRKGLFLVASTAMIVLTRGDVLVGVLGLFALLLLALTDDEFVQS
jgi:hypothetical protein